MNSIGSSTVMMCPRRSRLILSSIAARVVDFPEPVGPVTSTRPRGFSAIFATTPASPSSSNVRMLKGICRITKETEARQILNAEREVELILGLEALLLVLGENRVRQRQRVFRREDIVDVRVLNVPVDAELGTLARGDVQVGCVPLDHFLEETSEIYARRGRRWRG